MFIKDKRSFVESYCSSVERCVEDECCLMGKIWRHYSDDAVPCLDFVDADEDELDRAIKLIIDGKSEDPVERPSHYTNGAVECIDAIKASMTPTEYVGFLKGQIIKYVWRYKLKGKPLEDLKKARYYLERLIAATDCEEATV